MSQATGDLLYVSWGGTGRATSVRQAMRQAVAESRGLTYLAVLDDVNFSDLDDSMLGLVTDELRWLLDAQLDLTSTQLGAEDVEVRLLVRAGEVAALVAEVAGTIGAGRVLIGAPVPLTEHETIEMLTERIAAATGVSTTLVDSGD